DRERPRPRTRGVHPHGAARHRGTVHGRRARICRTRPARRVRAAARLPYRTHRAHRPQPRRSPRPPDRRHGTRGPRVRPRPGPRHPVRSPDAAMYQVRRAVLAGRKLSIHYAAVGQQAQWRTVDPIGLVTVGDRGYLLATRSGADRTYRLARIRAAETLAEAAHRPAQVDLDRLWEERAAGFRDRGDHLTVRVRVSPGRRDELLDTALGVRAPDGQPPDADGWFRLDVTFQDTEHAHWALWRLAPDIEALAPASLRAALRDHALS